MGERSKAEFELRNMDTGTAGAGGEMIPEGFMRELEIALLAFGGLRRVCRILSTTGDNPIRWPTMDDTGNAGALIAEGADAGASVDPTFAQVTLSAYKFTSNPVLVTAELIDDSAFDIAALLGSELGMRIGRATSAYFATGTGTDQPQGITNAPVGKTAASTAAVTFDEVIDLIHSVDPAYRTFPSCGFAFNDATLAELRKLKDLEGRYYWQPGTIESEPSRIFGFPYVVVQEMPSFAASAKPIVFGAMEKFILRDHAAYRFYRLVERYRVEQDSDAWIAYSRHDSRLLDAGTNPLKVLQMAAA
jgi:HK97 family phage major capsid protein